MKLLDTHLFQTGTPDELRHLVMYLSRAVKYIGYHIKTGDLGLAGTANKSGEDQLALDVFADQMVVENLKQCRHVALAASEEQDEEIICHADDKGKPVGPFSVAYDPLDGSSLVNANLAIGSVFGIYEGQGFIGKTGRSQVAALYAVYGPRTTIVYSTGTGVHEFTLNDVGEFTLTKENIRITEDSKYFAPGNLRAATENKHYRQLVEDWMDQAYTLRYSGGMVPDINHIFMKGQGIFAYPPFPPKYPEGKLRLLFECNPFSFLAEQAGGASSNGKGAVLDAKINDIHQRSPIYIGSKKEVEKVAKALS